MRSWGINTGGFWFLKQITGKVIRRNRGGTRLERPVERANYKLAKALFFQLIFFPPMVDEGLKKGKVHADTALRQLPVLTGEYLSDVLSGCSGEGSPGEVGRPAELVREGLGDWELGDVSKQEATGRVNR